MSERSSFIIRRQPVKGSREEVVLSAAKGFYGRQFQEKVSLRLTEIFEPLVAIANGANEQDICRAIILAETNVKDYFQQLKNQIPGYISASNPPAHDSVEPKSNLRNPIPSDTDNPQEQEEQLLEPEFD